MRVARHCEHSFLDGRLPGGTVLDLGLHRGAFARAMVERYGCQVLGVEPDPALYEALPQLPLLTARNVAVGDGGPVTLHLNPAQDATTTTAAMRVPGAKEITVPSVTLDALLAEVPDAALVKVDIEGAELDALEQVTPQSLSRVDQITVEFHDVHAPAMAPRVDAVKRRLAQLGFVEMAFSRDNTDVLFVNSTRIRFDRWQQAWIAVRYKYPRGIARLVARAR